jgi:hypothetical protein
MIAPTVPTPVRVTGGPSVLEWVTGISAAGAALLAAAALYFAWKAGRDLTHDRRDTFELQIFREMLPLFDQQYVYWPPPWGPALTTLRTMIKGPLVALDALLQEIPSLGIPIEELSSPAGVDMQERRARLINEVRDELYAQIYIRTGQRRRPTL